LGCPIDLGGGEVRLPVLMYVTGYEVSDMNRIARCCCGSRARRHPASRGLWPSAIALRAWRRRRPDGRDQRSASILDIAIRDHQIDVISLVVSAVGGKLRNWLSISPIAKTPRSQAAPKNDASPLAG
jgi:elongation factor P hydroxylase